MAAMDIVKEAFFPPFEAVKVRLEVGEGSKCMKLELYFYDAGLLPSHIVVYYYEESGVA